MTKPDTSGWTKKDWDAESYRLSGILITEAIAIHKKYGPKLLEHFYQAILASRLRRRGLEVETEVPVTVIDEGVKVDLAFRMDLVINGLMVVELKVADALRPVHKQQLLTYLRLSGLRLGALLNFGTETLMPDGYKHYIN